MATKREALDTQLQQHGLVANDPSPPALTAPEEPKRPARQIGTTSQRVAEGANCFWQADNVLVTISRGGKLGDEMFTVTPDGTTIELRVIGNLEGLDPSKLMAATGRLRLISVKVGSTAYTYAKLTIPRKPVDPGFELVFPGEGATLKDGFVFIKEDGADTMAIRKLAPVVSAPKRAKKKK